MLNISYRATMKKKWWVCVSICAILSMFCGCTQQTGEKKNHRDTKKKNSRIDMVSDNHDLACIDNTIVYFTDKYICFYDIESEKVVTEDLDSNCNVLEVSAGDEYFYVFFEDSETYYLSLYNTDALMFRQITVPFQRMLVSDGMVYAYRDSDYKFSAFDCRIGNIEATHYLTESEFLSNIENTVSEWDEEVSVWNEMSGEDVLQIGTKTFYRYPPDGYSHQLPFYSDDKQLTRIQQFYYTQYADGALSTPPDRAMTRNNLEQLQGMMKKKEKNFITYASEVDGVMYGVCNVYKDQSFLVSSLDTASVDYSFSFFYNEDTGSLEKMDEYQGMELIYSDGKHVITHKSDGVYYMDSATDEGNKILDYDGAISVTVLDGLLLVQKKESNKTDGDDINGGADATFVKKLWEK